jgi:pimeloyl-ACP methyl ester carboxylesterase
MLPSDPSSFAATIKAPPLRLLALEARVAAELPLFVLRTPMLRRLPRGDGHPVMVIPGFGANDMMTLPLRRALRRLGYASYGWGQGYNLGMRPPIKVALARRLAQLHKDHGAPVTLIGWSLGGVFAREMARAQPQLVRRVFTLGTPFNGSPHGNNLNLLFRLVNGRRPAQLDHAGFERRRRTPPVPCVALHSKSDGLVAWRCSLEDPAPHTENIEVRGSHCGLVFNFDVLRALAERLPRPASGAGPTPAGAASNPVSASASASASTPT